MKQQINKSLLSVLSKCFLAVSSLGLLLVLPLCCPAHTVLLRSPDSLMLLCEFSSLLFLDPALVERREGRGGIERKGDGWGKTGRLTKMPR